jgi:hypothetical protein
MVFAKLIFFPAKFFFAQKDFTFPKYQKKVLAEKKINLAKKKKTFRALFKKLAHSGI